MSAFRKCISQKVLLVWMSDSFPFNKCCGYDCHQGFAPMPEAERAHTGSSLVGQLTAGNSKRACAKHLELWPREKSIAHSSLLVWLETFFLASMQIYSGSCRGPRLLVWANRSQAKQVNEIQRSGEWAVGLLWRGPVTAGALSAHYAVQRGVMQELANQNRASSLGGGP